MSSSQQLSNQEESSRGNPLGLVRINSSRGEVVINDDHIFEISVPICEELMISMGGRSFRIKGLLDSSEEVSHVGEVIGKNKEG